MPFLFLYWLMRPKIRPLGVGVGGLTVDEFQSRCLSLSLACIPMAEDWLLNLWCAHCWGNNFKFAQLTVCPSHRRRVLLFNVHPRNANAYFAQCTLHNCKQIVKCTFCAMRILYTVQYLAHIPKSCEVHNCTCCALYNIHTACAMPYYKHTVLWSAYKVMCLCTCKCSAHDEQCTWWAVHMMNSAHDEQYTWWAVHMMNSAHDEQYTCWAVHMMSSAHDEQYTWWAVHMMSSAHDEQYTW
jgi:hypothetical protein